MTVDSDSELVLLALGEPWRRGTAEARRQFLQAEETKVKVPVSVVTIWQPEPGRYQPAFSPIVASPHLSGWPLRCRQWIFDKCTTWPKTPTQHAHRWFTSEDLTDHQPIAARFCPAPGCGLTVAADAERCWMHQPIDATEIGHGRLL